MNSGMRARVKRWAVGVVVIGLALSSASTALAVDAPVAADARDEMRKSAVEAAESGRYIVVLKEHALASYRGGKPGLAAPERAAGSERLNARGPAAQAYVSYLREQQRAFESRLSGLLGRAPQVSMRMQHAINALVIELSPEDAKRVEGLPEVLLLSPERLLELHTDVGPALIGAEPIWNGTNPGSSGPAQGEGRVIAVIDSGINWGSPSFAAVGPVDSYAHVNPLGDGNYLGTCAPGGVDEGRCNAKLIGGYDFVCGAPANICTDPNQREEPGFGDTNGHGTHVASTAAGNRRDAQYVGNTVRIAGVAPHATIIAYDACYTEISTGLGRCPSSSTVASINQAVADGIVDVINYSIGGGEQPWTDPSSLAFLGAVNAGIYVAASAGNSGPGPNTMGHLEPWVSSTAAAQHGRGAFQQTMNVTGPAPVPASLAPLVLTPGAGGVALSATIPGTTPLRISAGIDTASDGCAAYPANTFAGAIAVIRRGTCGFAIKANNAAAAGAVAMILANNAAGTIAPSVPGTTIPVFSVTQADGNALRNFGQANPSTATAAIPFPPVGLPNTPDQLAAFSSRGPAGEFDLVKPDVTAPGSQILAAYAGTALTGSENLVEIISGTSMASPHQAGAALLLRQLRPSWTVPELKSALQMTSFRGVLREDGSAASPFDMGAGRVRVNLAANAGLVLDESFAAFQAANPASGGDPSTLNLASLGERFCINQCQFVRRFRNTGTSSVDWTAAVAGLTGTVSPASFSVAPGATVELTITINSSAIPFDGLHRHGWLELRRVSGSASDDLNLPISVSVPPPRLSLNPNAQAATLIEGTTGAVNVTVRNEGGFPLSFDADRTGVGVVGVANSSNQGIASGFRSTIYTDPATAGSQAQFAADDIVLGGPTRLRSIQVDGFVVSGQPLTAAATNLTWSLYPDASGLPAGNPQTSPAAAVWTYTSTPTGPGVSTVGSNTIALDLVAAGQNVNLPAGRYWVLVNTRGTFANRFAWYGSNDTNGNSGFASITVATNGTGNWVANPSLPGLTMRVRGEVDCSASWVGAATPDTGNIDRLQQTQVSVPLGPTAAGSYIGAACFATNDPQAPRVASAINLTVEPARLAFSTAPSATATVAQAFAVQPTITVQDGAGVTQTGYTLPVTLELASGAGPLTCDANPVTPVNGVATFSGCRLGNVGTVSLRAVSGGATNSLTNPQVVVRSGPPARLAFSPAPSATATAGQAIAVQPTVRIQDSFGNLVDDATAAVTLRLASGSGVLSCDANPVNAVAGVASFSGCSLNRAGTVTLDASMTGIASATAQPSIVVAAATPTQLEFSTSPPATATIGMPWMPQPAITLRDALGNVALDATAPVTLFLASGAGTLSCATNPVVPVKGVASFSGCRVDAIGSITLGASTSGIANTTTNPAVLITRGPPTRLVFTTAPSPTATAGVAFAVQPVVRVEDEFGNPVTDKPIDITLGLASGSGPISCSANTVAAVAGVASFSGCRINTAGTVTLNASAPGIAGSTTQPQVVIAAAAATRLVFVTPPSATATAGQAFAVQASIALQDAFNNVVTDAATPITLRIATGTGPLQCTANPVTPVAGVANFAGCRVDTAGTLTLDASAGSIANATSTPQVVVSAAAPSRLEFAPAPSATATAGVAFAVQPQLRVLDAFGNLATTATTPVTLSLASGSGALVCAANSVTPSAGIAAFSGCRIDTAGTVTVNASSGSIAAATSTPQIVISAAGANRLAFSVAPSSTAQAGQAWLQQPVVRVEDAFGNPVSAPAIVTLSLVSGSGPLVCDANPVTAVAGVASFSGCRINTAGTVTLAASASGLGSTVTAPSVVIGAGVPDRLVFTTLPSAQVNVGMAWPQQPAVSIQDAFGNVVTAATTPVTLALASGAGPLVCTGNPVTPVAGVAQFAGCRLSSAGVVTLTASTAGIAATTTQPQVSAVQARAAVVPTADRWALLLLIALVVAVAVSQRAMLRAE